ncbi:AdoMet-dependent rRNA methyltransferase spb1 [Saitoella coloradoensis]
MGKYDKKQGKGRLDKWYKLAKEQGYRARSAFKLIQLNKKYNFLQKSKVLIDLCAAPGGWLQVAAKYMPASALILGVDLAPIKPIPKVITWVDDITTEKCRHQLRQHMKTWKADTVLHDGAPNVGAAWLQDAYSQAELVLKSLQLATEFLVEGGTFVTKVFRSKDYNNLMWVFNQLFKSVEATKPPSSRNVSAEIFVVCRGYKAPQKLDPKFLDPKAVFEDLEAQPENQEAKVFQPEKRKRHREGYEEGDYTQYKAIPVMDFITSVEPIQLLGLSSTFTLNADDEQTRQIKKMEETTPEIIECCRDLKVLGKKDFRSILKWRLAVREELGLSNKSKPAEEEEKVEIVPMDEEEQLEQDLANLNAAEIARRKRDKRKENERKNKNIQRMQMNMLTPHDLGTDQAQDETTFSLKTVEKHGGVDKVAKGSMDAIPEDEEDEEEDFGDDSDLDSSDEVDRLELEMDAMYEDYTNRKAEANAKYRAKKARQEVDGGEWRGFEASDAENEDGEADEGLGASVSDDESDELESDDDEPRVKKLSTDLQGEDLKADGLSRRAKQFFDQDIFQGLDDLDDLEEDEEEEDEDVEMGEEVEDVEDEDMEGLQAEEEDSDDESEPDFEIVAREPEAPEWNGVDSDDEGSKRKSGKGLDIITEEAMTLAHQIATKQKTAKDVVDEHFNKYAFADRDGLPTWFLDDEKSHSKPHRPITKEAAAAIKEKMRALNARPIKKVSEAKARKKMREIKQAEKLAKKADFINENEDLTEKEKSKNITQVMSKLGKGKRPKQKVTVVRATGSTKGQGRPKGVKGKYKMVDSRGKKEMRALKRIAKKKK